MGSLVGPQVTLDQANLDPFQALTSARGEPVENADVVTVYQEPTNEVVANEPSPSCDERTHLQQIPSLKAR
jgi:hypothetical protein